MHNECPGKRRSYFTALSKSPACICVCVCVCVLATKPITHSIRKRFRYGPKSVHGAVGGGRGGPTLNPEETTHLFNGVNCVNGMPQSKLHESGMGKVGGG